MVSIKGKMVNIKAIIGDTFSSAYQAMGNILVARISEVGVQCGNFHFQADSVVGF